VSGAKLIEQMRANPRHWRIGEVERLCAGFGIGCDPPRKGSHYKVSHQATPSILTIPAYRPIRPVYIRERVRFVDQVREQAK
jgi:hypothetical protein